MKHFFTAIIATFFFSVFTITAQSFAINRVILNTGTSIEGEILLQNNDFIVLRTMEGNRYQFNLNDVRTIFQNDRVIYPETNLRNETENTDSIDNNHRKITLNTGEIIIGEIILENEQVIMIRALNGNRFQFRRNEIGSIEDISEDELNSILPTESEPETGNKFRMMPDLREGVSHSGRAYGWALETQISLLLGGKDLFLPNSYIGIGVGYNPVFAPDYNNNEVISFLPVFLRFQSYIWYRKFTPYVEVDAGYSFALSDCFGGGIHVNASIGILWKLSERNNLQLGLYGGFHSFSANLTEIRDFGSYNYYGRTVGQRFGLKTSISF